MPSAPILSDSELDRYQRHIVLPEIGGQGQMRFRAARVAMFGAGGLGSPTLQYLAGAGIGSITIIDDDIVALSNLQRQTLFGTADIGRPKAVAAAERLAALNPHVEFHTHMVRLNTENAPALLANHDVIADGCDNFHSRGLINAATIQLSIPLVSGALGPFQGQVGVFAGHRPDVACWACFAGDPPDLPGASCADTGILGPVAGIVGTMQAMEILRLIHPFGENRLGKLWLFDGLSMTNRSVSVPKDPNCPACSSS